MHHELIDPLGTIYQADPICDDVNATLPLEVLVVVFDSSHYSTSLGKKKLRQIESDLNQHTKIRHPGVARVYAVKLTIHHSDHPRLAILMEQRPSLTMRDLLDECDFLRQDRAQVRAGLFQRRSFFSPEV